jgi:Spy/CpxP family protein refolding chaperone
MDRYVARANIDHYLSLLNGSDLAPHNRSTITKLLIAEEDKLGRDLEHLEFAEARAAKSRDRLNYFRKLREAFAEGSPDRARADSLLKNMEAIHKLWEQFCQEMRERLNSSHL